MTRSLQSLIDGDLEQAVEIIAERAVMGRQRRVLAEKRAAGSAADLYNSVVDPVSNNVVQPVRDAVSSGMAGSASPEVIKQIANAAGRGLVGAGVGAGVGFLGSAMRKKNKRPLSSMLTGAALGGVAGAGGSLAWDNMQGLANAPPPPPDVQDPRQQLVDIHKAHGAGTSPWFNYGAPLAGGAAVDVAGTAYARRLSRPGYLQAGADAGKGPKELQDYVAKARPDQLAKLHKPVKGMVQLDPAEVPARNVQNLVAELGTTPAGTPDLATLKANLAAQRAQLDPKHVEILDRLIAKADQNPQSFKTLLADPTSRTIGHTGANLPTFRANLRSGHLDNMIGNDPAAWDFVKELKEYENIASNTALPQDVRAAAEANLRAHVNAKGVSGGKGKGGGGGFPGPHNPQNKGVLSNYWSEMTGANSKAVELPEPVLNSLSAGPALHNPVDAKQLYEHISKNKLPGMTPEMHQAFLTDPNAETALAHTLTTGEPLQIAGRSYNAREIRNMASAGVEATGPPATLSGPFAGARWRGMHIPRYAAYPALIAGGWGMNQALGTKDLPPDALTTLWRTNKPAAQALAAKLNQSATMRANGDTYGADRLEAEYYKDFKDVVGKLAR